MRDDLIEVESTNIKGGYRTRLKRIRSKVENVVKLALILCQGAATFPEVSCYG